MKKSLLSVALVMVLRAAPLGAQGSADAAAALAQLNAQMTAAMVPAHSWITACLPMGNGAHVIWSDPMQFDPWNNTLVINPAQIDANGQIVLGPRWVRRVAIPDWSELISPPCPGEKRED